MSSVKVLEGAVLLKDGSLLILIDLFDDVEKRGSFIGAYPALIKGKPYGALAIELKDMEFLLANPEEIPKSWLKYTVVGLGAQMHEEKKWPTYVYYPVIKLAGEVRRILWEREFHGIYKFLCKVIPSKS